MLKRGFVSGALAAALAVSAFSGLAIARELKVTVEGADRTAATRQEASTGVTTLTGAPLTNTGGELRARLTELMRKGSGEGLEKVQLIGRVRGVRSGQSTIGQVVWYGLAADVKSGPRQAGLESPLKSRFIARSDTVPEATSLKATGDIAGLLAAARTLLAEAGDKDKASEDESAAKEDEPKKAEAGRGSNVTMAPRTGGPVNDQAANYQPLDLPEKTASEPARYEMVTADGCQPRIDMAQGVVVLTSRTVTMEDGEKVAESACTDTFDRYTIQKSYTGCADDIDVAARKAYPQYRPYWVDDAGNPNYITDCQPDTNEVFLITEDYNTCAPLIDVAQNRVTEAFELVYTNRQGVTSVVQGCQPHPEKVLALQQTHDGCGFRHDLANNVSWVQYRYIYQKEGVEHAVSACADQGEPVQHVIDVAACEPVVDLTAKLVVPRARRYIETEFGSVTIQECATLADQQQALKQTRDGCENAFVHNLDAGQSLLTMRWFHDVTGLRAYVTGCEATTEPPLLHQSQTVGWEHDDDRRVSKPITRIYINASIGEVEVSPAQVRADAPETPYVFVKTETIADDANATYNGCARIVPTIIVDTYRRPDTTTVQYQTGSGEPLPPIDECTRITETRLIYAQTTYTTNNVKSQIAFCTAAQEAAGRCMFDGAKIWPSQSPSPADLGSSGLNLTACDPGFPGYNQSYSVSFTHYSQSQSRIVVTYPEGAGGQTVPGSWQNSGSPVAQITGSCYRQGQST